MGQYDDEQYNGRNKYEENIGLIYLKIIKECITWVKKYYQFL